VPPLISTAWAPIGIAITRRKAKGYRRPLREPEGFIALEKFIAGD
jgi:hypothetical protein